jgi:hypothetical protein
VTRLLTLTLLLVSATSLPATTTTWDGQHSTAEITVTVAYFVPKDRAPLPDWRDRVGYFCRRIEAFHEREFGDQSTMRATMLDEPFVSDLDTTALREGDGDAIFFRTLREVDARLDFGKEADGPFPILLVLSEINWRPLDDFYRLQPTDDGPRFEGNYNGSEHFPGANSGGARATYIARDRKGWGLVSADGWRVPYRGADCVVYHEGCGHTVGLPHPEPGNGSVMSFGQYNGWISESWLDRDQKAHMAWVPPAEEPDRSGNLFDHFRALPEPRVPRPDEPVSLALDWPAGAEVMSLRLRYQLDEYAPWVDVPVEGVTGAPSHIALATFDRPTPVSYRIDATLADGQTAELWGYFQVRQQPDENPQPGGARRELTREAPADVAPALALPGIDAEINLLAGIDPARDQVSGEWTLADGKLESPKAYGARIAVPGDVPAEYQVTAIVEPLDEPDGFLLGQVLEGQQFAVTLHYAPEGQTLSALENIDGENVSNYTTYREPLFQQGRLSQIVCTVRQTGVTVSVDGREIITWHGEPNRLSLSDYWKMPNTEQLFLGAYDCRYRIHRLTLLPIARDQ